jgi:hypothetical protein
MKRILTGLRLDKIAAVDKPCQEHATMTIMKRATSTDAANGVNPAGDPAGDHVDKKEKPMSDEAKKVADLEKAVADLTKRAEAAEAAKAAADALAKMSDKEKEHLAGLKDEDAKKAFTAMSAEDRAKAIGKAVENDEVLKFDGAEIRKSAVGEAQFAFMKSQQARIAKQDEEIAKERDARVMSDLRKRADDEFSHVPGSTDERAAMLKALNGMDEAVRKSFEAVLKAHEEVVKNAFNTMGHGNGKVAEGSADDQLDKMAKAHATKNNVPFAKAYTEVLATEEGRALYSKSLAEKPAVAA